MTRVNSSSARSKIVTESAHAPAIHIAGIRSRSTHDAVSEWSGAGDCDPADASGGGSASPDGQSETTHTLRGYASDFGSAIWRRRDDVREYQVEGEGLLVDPQSKAIYHLNETAWTIWRRCDGRSAASLAEALSKAYEVDQQTVLGHVTSVLELLELGGLLAREDGNGSSP